MTLAIDRAQRASVSDASILILGESGVGKELFAKFIHHQSTRRDRPFVAVNCPGLTETLLESELFGHEKGAFTGAVRQKKGKFELAHTGTIFLDELGDLSMPAQAKLLRAIEYKEFDRVGGETHVKVDVRVVAATHRNLHELIAQNRFRLDLLYRLDEITVEIPPLRERPEDIPLLAQHFIDELAPQLGKHVRKVADAASKVLLAHRWPGNVRELRAVVRRAVTLCDPGREALWVEDFGTHFTFEDSLAVNPLDDLSLESAEKLHITKVLQLSGFHKSRAAELLRISRPTLDKKIHDYRIQIPTRTL